MEDLVVTLSAKLNQFIEEARQGLRPNKAAAKRARKLSLEIEKQLKEYRKASVNS